MSDSTEAQVRRIYEEWHAGINSHDVPRVIALYAEKATLESPAILGRNRCCWEQHQAAWAIA
jgi:steroid Delta-isomerase